MEEQCSPQRCEVGPLIHDNFHVRGELSVNNNIRFLSEEYECSEFSDSIEDYVGDERKILKIRQRNKKKKNSMFLSKKHLGPALEVHLEGSPNLCKSDKRRYKICSTHRRTVSHLVGREDGWSEEDDLECGVGRSCGQARSWDDTLSQGSGIG